MADSMATDEFLAKVLRGERADWPFAEEDEARVIEAIQYHGISGLLAEQPARLESWPKAVREMIHEQAVSRAMWELRHQALVASLLERFKAAGTLALLMKGTAMAYDLYPNPAARERSDTDLLVDPAGRDRARELLAEAGFTPVSPAESLPEDLRAQENWLFEAPDGTEHLIDLHWRVMNYPAFDRLVTFADFAVGARLLPRLGEAAMAPARPMLLIHASLHRQGHERAPYFMDGKTYFGGDRLIWLKDIALLSAQMSDQEWQDFCDFAVERGLERPSFDGLALAYRILGSETPPPVRSALDHSGAAPKSYFQSGPLRRALSDVRAIPGGQRKWRYVAARLMPNEDFMRRKYPDLAGEPLARLYLRRLADFFRPRQRTGH